MSIINVSAGVAATMGTFVSGQATFEMEDRSETTGDSATRVLAPPRWTLNIASIEALNAAESVEWELLMLKMRGSVNRLAAWDVSRPAPRGTMRGTLQLAASVAVGAESLQITGGLSQAGTTLKMGDWVQVGSGLGTSQLFKVAADATANGSGVITIAVEPPARLAFSSGVSVVWDKPVAYYRKVGTSTSYSAMAGSLNYTGHALDLIETWN